MNSKKTLSPLEKVADEIIEVHLGTQKLSTKQREYARNIIADCLSLNTESERYDRFFAFAMNELKEQLHRGR